MLDVGSKIRLIWRDGYTVDGKGIQDYVVFRNTDDKSQYGIVNVNTGKCLVKAQPTMRELEIIFTELLRRYCIRYCEIR